MPSPALIILCHAFFTAALLAAAVGDVRHYRIPNRLVLGLAMGAPGYYLASGLGAAVALTALIGALVLLALGIPLFQQGWIGGGDVKLAAAAALWLGPAGTFVFVVYTALAGALLAFMVIGFLAFARRGGTPLEASAARLPYGAAIAAGALAAFAETRLEWF